MTSKGDIYLELLALRCQRGQREAFQDLVRLWEKRLFYFIRRLVGSEQDAWDVLQETWIKALKGIRSLQDPRRLAVWLYQIARHSAWSRLRQTYRQQRRIDDDDLTEVEAPPADCDDDAEVVHEGLGRLSPIYREVLTLFFLQDLSLEQIAQVTGVPLGTVKSRLHYARLALRQALECTLAYSHDSPKVAHHE